MDFSLWLPANFEWTDLRSIALDAERAGWHGLWVADHFMPNAPEPSAEPMGECFAQLAALAATVPRVRIGPLVAGNTYRHPAVVAKTAASIDRISGGRFVLGIGAGWQINEHAAYGLELGTVRERLSWFREACAIMQGLRDDEWTTIDGDRYQLTNAPLEPKPVGPLPILIGASGEKVMPRIVAQYAEEWNTWATPDVFAHKNQIMSEACEARDRDPSTLRRTTQALVFIGADGAERAAAMNERRASIGGTIDQLVEIVADYRTKGVDELIVPTAGIGDPRKVADFAAQFHEEVASQLGS